MLEKWASYLDYEVSNLGRIRKNGRLLKPQLKHGYLTVNVYGVCTGVHRVVALAWIPNPHNLSDVNHKDKNKQNNNVDNLEWLSHQDNSKHAHNVDAKMREVLALKDSHSIREIAHLTNIPKSTVHRLLRSRATQ